MHPINMKNATAPTLLEVIPADKMKAIYDKAKAICVYKTQKHEFPLFVENIMFTKYVPGFEGMYVTNIQGDLASLERVVEFGASDSYRRSTTVAAKVHRSKRDVYKLCHGGTAVMLTREALIFYSGFKKPTFNEETVFPVEYKGKKWISWLPGNLHLKAAIATDGSVLTMESMAIRQGECRNEFYTYSEERIYDAAVSFSYRNKEKTMPVPRHELQEYAKLKCTVLGIQP